MNEEASVATVIDDIRSHCRCEIVLVDDESTDNTVAIARQLGVTVLEMGINCGAWKATQTGIRYAVDKGFDTVITMDADGQHKAKYIDKLLKQKQLGYDLVIGSCIARGTRGRHIAWKVFKFISRLEINDITSGFKVYGKSAMQVLSGRRASMLEYQDIGVLFLLKHCGMKYSEVDVNMEQRVEGISRIFRSWSNVFSYLIYTFILTFAKATPILGKKYKMQVLKEKNLD
ncbi:MAG: glycosyltransferase [Alteromonadaceae bacterium]|nr:glycosyltransferase [Alteromonadaceae bacterium]